MKITCPRQYIDAVNLLLIDVKIASTTLSLYCHLQHIRPSLNLRLATFDKSKAELEEEAPTTLGSNACGAKG